MVKRYISFIFTTFFMINLAVGAERDHENSLSYVKTKYSNDKLEVFRVMAGKFIVGCAGFYKINEGNIFLNILPDKSGSTIFPKSSIAFSGDHGGVDLDVYFAGKRHKIRGIYDIDETVVIPLVDKKVVDGFLSSDLMINGAKPNNEAINILWTSVMKCSSEKL